MLLKKDSFRLRARLFEYDRLQEAAGSKHTKHTIVHYSIRFRTAKDLKIVSNYWLLQRLLGYFPILALYPVIWHTINTIALN